MAIIAFIPVRGGSKSIPLKNIKHLAGKPLVCWSIEALEKCDKIDQIVVATDSDEIKQTVASFNYSKTILYNRLSENASDTASTESVMIECIKAMLLQMTDIFILVQATSPLTKAEDFNNGLNLFFEKKYDSLLTCVRLKRFLWTEDGNSKNYNYKNRPRRQNFEGDLMENGAFYISTVNNILLSGNRLSGKIGIYEMPEYTATEIDEPDDWDVMEKLVRKYSSNRHSNTEIKLFLTDVDGVLTDGGMYYSENGVESKKFNTKDGMAFQLLHEMGIKTGIITSENTKIVENRASKLKLDYLVQGKSDGGKLQSAIQICYDEKFALDNVVYVGDDINCLELLTQVGYSFCPADADKAIKNIHGITILKSKGGDGVVRECYEYLKENYLLG